MTARISKDFVFQSCVHFFDSFSINSYKFSVWMDVSTENIDEQNVAMDRIKYFVEEGLDNCLFIDSNTDKTVVENYVKAGIKICTLPEDPYDQVVGAVIMSKINAITEGKLFVTEIKIKSKLSDDVEFYISSEEHIDFLSIKNLWYSQSNTSISDWTRKSTKKEKIVELKKDMLDWADIGLDWCTKIKLSDSDVVYLNLDK